MALVGNIFRLWIFRKLKLNLNVHTNEKLITSRVWIPWEKTWNKRKPLIVKNGGGANWRIDSKTNGSKKRQEPTSIFLNDWEAGKFKYFLSKNMADIVHFIADSQLIIGEINFHTRMRRLDSIKLQSKGEDDHFCNRCWKGRRAVYSMANQPHGHRKFWDVDKAQMLFTRC